MEWKRKLADRCEIEKQEIRSLWEKCELPEWSNRDDALDDWHNGDKHVFALAIAFQDQVSFLRCLERECRNIDQILWSFKNSPSKPSPSEALKSGIDAYDLAYFKGDPHRWSIEFMMWNATPFLAERSPEQPAMERFVISETADLALLDSLEEALADSAQLWKEWGPGSFEIQDGLNARIQALNSLEVSSQVLLDREHYSPIADIRREIRESKKIEILNERGNLRRRKRPSTETAKVGFADDDEPEEPRMETVAKMTLPIPGGTGLIQRALSFLKSTVRRLHALKEVKRVPRFEGLVSPQSSGLFSFIAVTAVISSMGFIMLAITKNQGFCNGISQTILLIFQAYCACDSRRKGRKQQGDEETSRYGGLIQTPDHFHLYIVSGALASFVSTCLYPYHGSISTLFSWLANLCQVAGLVCIHNASFASSTAHP